MREWPQIKVRMSPEMKRRLTEEAKRNRRSMNGEITYRLHVTLSEPPKNENPGAATPGLSDENSHYP